MYGVKQIVYIIEPDESICEGLMVLLGIMDIRTLSYPDASAFLDSVSMKDLSSGYLILDASLPGLDCLALLKKLRQTNVTSPIFVLADTFSKDIVDQALQAGATDVIVKPLVAEHLLTRLQQVLH